MSTFPQSWNYKWKTKVTADSPYSTTATVTSAIPLTTAINTVNTITSAAILSPTTTDKSTITTNVTAAATSDTGCTTTTATTTNVAATDTTNVTAAGYCNCCYYYYIANIQCIQYNNNILFLFPCYISEGTESEDHYLRSLSIPEFDWRK
jgi:hypothetical protein